MRRAAIIFSLVLVLLPCGTSSASSDARRFLSYGGHEANCETEMAHLDNYAIELQNAPGATAYVIAYGGRLGTARSEMRTRRARIRRYLVSERGIDPGRVVVLDGGFRESLTIELWLVPDGSAAPSPEPTVNPKKVKYSKGRYSVSCSTFY